MGETKWGYCSVRKFALGENSHWCEISRCENSHWCKNSHWVKIRTGAKFRTGAKILTGANDLVMLVIFTCLVLRYRILYRNITSPSAQ